MSVSFVLLPLLAALATLYRYEVRSQRLKALRSRARCALTIHYLADSSRARTSQSRTKYQLAWQNIKVQLTMPVLMVAGGAAFMLYNMFAQLLLAILGACLAAFIAAKMFAAHLARKECQLLEAQLPDAIEVFARSIAAGVPLQRAVLSVSEAFDGVLSREFRTIYDSLLLGVPFQQAFNDSAQRVDSEAFGYFTAILSLNSETGGPLVEALTNLGSSLREKSKIEHKVQALTAEPRVAARVVTGIPVVLLSMQYVKQPKQIDFLLHDPDGQMVLAYALVSILIGLLWINRLTKVS